MLEKTTLNSIEESIRKRRETDRIMWFSMWFLTAVATFGVAFFPMTYFLIDRRNKHFIRQKKLEELLIKDFKTLQVEAEEPPIKRKTWIWTASIALIIPVFAITYLLSKDLLLHEKRQKKLFEEILGMKISEEPSINIKKCIILTIVTFGLGIVYWMYKIFNAYNNHFKKQWKLEDEIIRHITNGAAGK